MAKEIEQSVVDLLQEQIDALDNRVQLLEIIAKKGGGGPAASEGPKLKKVIQVNIGKQKFFCETEQEVQILNAKHPGGTSESFTLELDEATADSYLNRPENKEALKRAS